MEIIQILITIIIGILAGTFTGLIPGIHINLIATFTIISLNKILQYATPQQITIFILAMGITHTFIDFIPSLLFGVPSSDTALSILPGHKLVLEGNAYKAIQLSALGSLGGILFIMIISPIFYLSLTTVYNTIKSIIPYLLIITIIIPIIKEPTKNQKIYAIFVISLCAALGIFTLNTHLTSQPLLLLFSGLFGISTLLQSLNTKNSTLPEQTYNTKINIDKHFIKSIIAGGLSSTLCSITPGIGNAQAATISSNLFKKLDSELFITTLSAINTINFTLSLLTLYIINKARNGAIIVLKQLPISLTIPDIKLYLIIIAIISILCYFLTLYLGKIIIKIITKLNIKKINIAIIILVISIIYYLTDIYALLILTASTTLGIFTLNIGIKRIHLMSILIIPVILNLI